MVGIDIVHLVRLNLDNAFIKLVLTDDEINIFNDIKTEERKREYLGGRFAAKEAIFKATQDRNYLAYIILNDEVNRPYVKDHEEIAISISHDGEYAIAIAIIK